MAQPRQLRTCVGCGRRRSRGEMIRLVVDGGKVVVDRERAAAGRGAWLCPARPCLDRAEKRRALNRALRLESEAGAVGLDGAQRETFETLIGEDTSGEGSSL